MSEEMTRDYRWYIVHTQHGYENKVRERLEKRIKENGMSDLVVDIYIPSETVQKNKNGKKGKKSLTKREGSGNMSKLSARVVQRRQNFTEA